MMRRNTMVCAVLGALIGLGTLAGNAQAATRAGLFYTQEEIAQWAIRSGTGPFVKPGDFSKNSPGQWDAVLAATEKFTRDPVGDRWTNYYTGTGCVPQHTAHNKAHDAVHKGDDMLKAAFYAMVKNDSAVGQLVRQELLVQATDPMLDFSNAQRWCVMGDNTPGFQIAEWLIRLLMSADMLSARGFLSDDDQKVLKPWFTKAAVFMQSNYDPTLDQLFKQRSGDYPIADRFITKDSTQLIYSSDSGLGPYSHSVQRHYNNRRSAMALFVGLTGLYTGNAAFEASGTRFFKEWMMFAIRPSGIGIELFRGILPSPPEADHNPYVGAMYVWATIAHYSMMADAKARAGRPELYTYATTGGTNVPAWGNDNTAVTGTAPPKNFLKVMYKALEFQNGQFTGYATADPAVYTSNLRYGYRVDGRKDLNPNSEKVYVPDTWLAQANRWYKDATVTANYTRVAPGTSSYPLNPGSTGPANGYTYPGAIMPAPLFMFHGINVDPYH